MNSSNRPNRKTIVKLLATGALLAATILLTPATTLAACNETCADLCLARRDQCLANGNSEAICASNLHWCVLRCGCA